MIWGCGADLTKSRVHYLGYSLTLWDSIPKGARIETECVSGQIKKYMKFDMDVLCDICGLKFEDIFDEIIIGPRSSQQLGDLRAFLEEKELNNLAKKIRISDCPLR